MPTAADIGQWRDRPTASFWPKARLVMVTATVTSAAWVVAGALWLNARMPRPARPALPVAVAAPDKLAFSEPAAQAAMGDSAQVASVQAMPVKGVSSAALVDTYTQSRAGGARVHDAIDIMAPAGTPVLAALAGRVEKLFVSRDGGNTVYVRARDGATMAYYAHLAAYAPGLAEGQVVKPGQVLGAVGATGNADPAAPHLHFALMRTTPQARWDEGEPFNPYPLLRRLP